MDGAYLHDRVIGGGDAVKRRRETPWGEDERRRGRFRSVSDREDERNRRRHHEDRDSRRPWWFRLVFWRRNDGRRRRRREESRRLSPFRSLFGAEKTRNREKCVKERKQKKKENNNYNAPMPDTWLKNQVKKRSPKSQIKDRLSPIYFVLNWLNGEFPLKTHLDPAIILVLGSTPRRFILSRRLVWACQKHWGTS